MKREILIATTNPGKVAEIQACLETVAKCLSLSDFRGVPKVEEDGATFVENACKKALQYAKTTGLWTISDDSGLIINALYDAPGIRSARFSGDKLKTKNRSLIDRRNIAKVLRVLKGIPKERRTAKFVCCLCLARPDEILIEVEGTLEGLITERPIGENGFGYDPIFFVPHLNKTVAQLTTDEKNAISHRGNAIRKLKPLLDELLQGL